MGYLKFAGEAFDFGGLTRGCRPQGMIDGDRHKPRSVLERSAPACGKHEQRGRIRTAGNREDKNGVRSETGKQRLSLKCRDRQVVFSS